MSIPTQSLLANLTHQAKPSWHSPLATTSQSTLDTAQALQAAFACKAWQAFWPKVNAL